MVAQKRARKSAPRGAQSGTKRKRLPSTADPRDGGASSKLIDAMIKAHGGWQGEMMSCLRALIKQADPSIDEEVKWRKPSNPEGVPVWSHGGIICTGNFLKAAVRITFMQGAGLKDPAGLYNASLAGNRMRAIDFSEGDEVDAAAFKDLVRAAVAQNRPKGLGG